MNCLNCSKYLKEAIDSVYAQTYKDWEIIFWDNASSDNSAEIAKSYDGRLRYFRGKSTVPLGEARNLAIQEARGEYIAFLDCDDMWLPEKLEKQVHVLASNPNVDFNYCNYFSLIMPRRHHLILRFKRRQPEGNVFERFLHYYPVNMQTVMLRRAVLDKLDGIFDGRFNLCEEYDLFMRILYNSEAAYIHEPLVIYRLHADMSSIQFMSGYPEEIACVLDKLKKQYPLLESRYASAMEHARAMVAYLRAKIDMAQGNPKKAREQIDPYKKTDYRFLVLYVTTFLPAGIWRMLQAVKNDSLFRLLPDHRGD